VVKLSTAAKRAASDFAEEGKKKKQTPVPPENSDCERPFVRKRKERHPTGLTGKKRPTKMGVFTDPKPAQGGGRDRAR